jgi:hypothetical protein
MPPPSFGAGLPKKISAVTRITRQTLYRHVAPDGTLRMDGLKVIEGGKIRYGQKK